MRPAPYDNEIKLPESLRTAVVSGPEGLTDEYVAPVEAIIGLGRVRPEAPLVQEYLLRIKLDEGDLDSLIKHGEFYILFCGGIVPFSFYRHEEIDLETLGGSKEGEPDEPTS